MADESPSAVITDWFRRVWNEGDERAIYERFSPEGEAYGLGPEPLVGPGAFHQFWLQMRQVLSDIEIEVLDAIDDGSRGYVRCAANVTFQGARVRFEGAVQTEVRGGQIRRAWNYWDFLTLMEGIGSIAPNAFAMALSGKRFA
ncbi:MAG: ester cyclase [Planctomycetota bacterium]|nr:ester cyclase [Planctomycetota bacterium]